MPAFRVSKRSRKRRSGTIRAVAIELGIHERTLRRWIAQPKLRPALRAYRRGKQWRLDVPETYPEFERYKEAVFRAVRPFRRILRKTVSRLTKKIKRALGYHEEHKVLRELGLSILRLAIDLKLSEATPTPAFKKRSEIRRAATDCRGMVRIIAAQRGLYGNDIFKTLEYLDCADSRQRELLKIWPTRAHWEKASGERRHLWQERTLVEAAYELAKENKSITGKSLARRLFLNEGRELMWKQAEKLKQLPDAYLPLNIYSYGRRGISLRLFRQRYKRGKVVKARNIAEGTVRSEYGDTRGEDTRVKEIRKFVPAKNTCADESVVQAIKECEKALREASTDARRKVLRE
jgi:hypothetical protein